MRCLRKSTEAMWKAETTLSPLPNTRHLLPIPAKETIFIRRLSG
jgi:hypothetical protein